MWTNITVLQKKNLQLSRELITRSLESQLFFIQYKKASHTTLLLNSYKHTRLSFTRLLEKLSKRFLNPSKISKDHIFYILNIHTVFNCGIILKGQWWQQKTRREMYCVNTTGDINFIWFQRDDCCLLVVSLGGGTPTKLSFCTLFLELTCRNTMRLPLSFAPSSEADIQPVSPNNGDLRVTEKEVTGGQAEREKED